jgi:hypothetical protein
VLGPAPVHSDRVVGLEPRDRLLGSDSAHIALPLTEDLRSLDQHELGATDPPFHTIVRRNLATFFSSKKMAAFEPMVRRACDALAESLAGLTPPPDSPSALQTATTKRRWENSRPRATVSPSTSRMHVPSGALVVTVADVPGMKPTSLR